jgi:DnaJ-class molecular chaperone
VDNAQSRAASRESINTPPDSLSLYRNLLGLGPRFTGEELKAAYRSAAAMYHPDRFAAATRKERETAGDLMKKVNEAYETLKDAAM